MLVWRNFTLEAGIWKDEFKITYCWLGFLFCSLIYDTILYKFTLLNVISNVSISSACNFLSTLYKLRHPMPSSEWWKGQIFRALTYFDSVQKIPAGAKISSASLLTLEKHQVDLYPVTSFIHSDKGTALIDLHLSLQSYDNGLLTILPKEQKTSIIFPRAGTQKVLSFLNLESLFSSCGK